MVLAIGVSHLGACFAFLVTLLRHGCLVAVGRIVGYTTCLNERWIYLVVLSVALMVVVAPFGAVDGMVLGAVFEDEVAVLFRLEWAPATHFLVTGERRY